MKNGLLLLPLVLVVLAVAVGSLQNRKQTDWAARFHKHGQDVVAIAAQDREVVRLQSQPPTKARNQALARARQALREAVETERADRRTIQGYFKTYD